ncbi:hypothetical protein BHE74_00018601, partial [Ensete ventricosum]
VTGTWTARYRVVPPKIDRRRSIEGEKGKKKKRKRRKKEKRGTYFPAPSSSARRRRPQSLPAGRFFSRAKRRNVSLRVEKGRGDRVDTTQDAIPWEEIGVFVAEEDVPKLDTILTSIPIEVILRKQRLLANPSMKQAMLFPQPAQPGDAFHQILNGLARKLPHDENVYLKQGQKILNWTAGPVGDLKPW